MYIADLHIHSKYSRATSKNGDIPHLDLWARRKGIGLVGTGDFTHPAWRRRWRRLWSPRKRGYTASERKIASEISAIFPHRRASSFQGKSAAFISRTEKCARC